MAIQQPRKFNHQAEQEGRGASHSKQEVHSLPHSTLLSTSSIVSLLKVKKNKKSFVAANKSSHHPVIFAATTTVDANTFLAKPSSDSPTTTTTMRRVSSRQRFTIEDDFSAAAIVSDTEEDDESYEEVGLSLEQQLTRKRVRIQRAISAESLSSLLLPPPPPSPCSLKDALNDDLQLNIVSFLPEQDIRTVITLNSFYHELLLSGDATQVWKGLCSQRWGTEYSTASISTATGDHFSHLLQQASPCHPSQVDPKSFLPPLVHRLRHVRDRLPPLNFSLCKDHLNRVQYTGSVGTGDRCVKANAPLARPRRNEGNASTNNSAKLSNPFMDFLCRGAAGVVGSHKAFNATPFVAPFVNHASQTVLTPRLVSYYEVSILQKPPVDDEPPSAVRARLLGNDNNHTQQQQQQQAAPNDCVAVGLSTETFSTHGRMPGWDTNSWGYHGDDEGLFHGSGEMLKRFGSSFGEGDVVGCGIDYTVDGIFYTLNGQFLGYGWTHVANLAEMDLYPTVGVDTNCPIQTNFGTEPFDFDLEMFANARMEFASTQQQQQRKHQAFRGKCKPTFRSR